ncbi:MAG: hypothetical protein ACPGSD_05025 [Flavobacteriales bacterium]
MRVILIIGLILMTSCISKKKNENQNRTYNNLDDLKSQIVEDEIESLLYIDSTYGYKTEVPNWLNLKETGNDRIWGGTFPSIKGIKNALLIKGFDKSEFNSFEHFTEIYITGNTFGKKTLYNEDQVWYGSNPRDLHDINNGVSCRVFTLFQNMIYHNQFSLIETKNAYLWIQFVATPETYDQNLPKFIEFVKGIEFL